MLAKKDFAKSTLGAAIAPADTALAVAAGDGAKFPSNGSFMAVIWGASYSSPSDDPGREVVMMSLSSGDSFSVTRAQEGTAAAAWNAGDHIAHTITAGTFSDFDVVGEIKMFAGVTAPSGWLACDGSAVSRTAYSALFNVIGTTFGAGDGATTFSLPDMRGRVPVGVGTGTGLTNRALAAIGGEENHALSNAEMPVHNHGGTAGGGPFATPYPAGTWPTTGGGAEAANPTIPNDGGGAAHNNMQPFLAINFIIRY